MNHLIIGLLLGLSLSVQAAQKSLNLDLSTLQTKPISENKFGNFSKLSVSGFENTKEIGAPELPVQTWLLQGKPSDIQVRVQVLKEETQDNLRPYPVQPQACRCETDQPKGFQFNAENYNKERSIYTVTYLGSFRGTPISRLDVRMAQYDQAASSVRFRTQMDVQFDAPEYNFARGDYKDYLLIVPEKNGEGVQEFALWKQSQGYNVFVEKVLSPANNLQGIAALIKKYYQEKGVDFVMIFGDEQAIPMFRVDTSGSYSTPSDLQYFTMDGADDQVPDMFYSRITASSVDQIRAQLGKSIEFESKSFQSNSGLKQIVGIASNEGYSPSDAEYIRQIEEQFKTALGVSALFLHQNDVQNSNPTVLNNQLNQGSFWLTYLGHGSGTSWPSMNRSYSTTDIEKLNNKPVVKPIIIDVACMNGKLVSGYLGTTFMKAESNSGGDRFGAAAYYGGTVNISWHPPAVMARGIAMEHMKKNFKHLGEALLAGQLYLAANWNDEGDVIDNFEWYHLQGDPGMNVQFQ